MASMSMTLCARGSYSRSWRIVGHKEKEEYIKLVLWLEKFIERGGDPDEVSDDEEEEDESGELSISAAELKPARGLTTPL
jgi:hypothetical protein